MPSLCFGRKGSRRIGGDWGEQEWEEEKKKETGRTERERDEVSKKCVGAEEEQRKKKGPTKRPGTQ